MTSDPRRRNLNIVHDTLSHYASSFCEVSSNLLEKFQFQAQFDLRHICDLALGRRNLTLVRDTPSHNVLSFCEVSLNLLQEFLNYC